MPPILGSKIKKSLFMFTSNDFAFEKTLVLMFTSMFFAFDEGNLCFMLASVYFFALVCRLLELKMLISTTGLRMLLHELSSGKAEFCDAISATKPRDNLTSSCNCFSASQYYR
jgi:hypothetical protein